MFSAKRSLLFTALAFLCFSCEKGGGQFSVLSSTNRFEQTTTYVPRQLDVLFVVDNSGSMSSSQSSLATHFPSFISFFKDKGYDFKIAVTTTDAFYGDQFVSSGCGSLCNIEQTRFKSGTTPKIYQINNQTPNLESVFASNVNVGISGSGDERAFSSFRAALSSNLNTGFRRSGAFLAIVIVSDEEDFSHDTISMNESYSQPTLHTVQSYRTYLESLTNGSSGNDFSVSTISILDETCRSSLGSGRKIGLRYMELASLTGGSQNSLCQNFDSVLNNISSTIANQTAAQFALNRVPVLSSIRVLVNGTLLSENGSNGWSYDSSRNIIQIKGAATPAAGDIVIINFDPMTIN